MNLTELLFDKSFWVHVWLVNGKPSINFNNGWMGVTTQTPDITMFKGSRLAIFSLQGMSFPDPFCLTDKEYESYLKMCNSLSVKYIGLFVSGRAIYETWSGVLPPNDVVDVFLNESSVITESMHQFSPRSNMRVKEFFDNDLPVNNKAVYINKHTLSNA